MMRSIVFLCSLILFWWENPNDYAVLAIAESGASSGRSSHHRALSAPAIGNNITALIVLMYFTDHADRPRPPREYFDTKCNGDISKYFQLQSYGQYRPKCVVWDWLPTDNTEKFYAKGVSNLQDSAQTAAMFTPVLKQIEANQSSNPNFWLQFDSNADGILDTVIVIHSGFSSTWSGDECDASAADRIQSQGRASSSGAWQNQFGDQLGSYSIASAYDGCNSSNWATMGSWTHEWTHQFGALDLYDRSVGRIGGVGGFDIMSSPYGLLGNGNKPGSISPWHKNLIGWLNYTEITTDGVYTIRASNSFPDIYVISSKYPSKEYLLIENRQTQDFDNIFGSGGLLIWHIDDTKQLQTQRGFPGQSGWPGNGNHYQVALLQADGQYGLEQGLDNGDLGDLWTSNTTLGPGTGSNFPNTDSYQSGVKVTGITISQISASGPTMTFQVTGLAPGSSPTTSAGSTPAPSESGGGTVATVPPAVIPAPSAPSGGGGGSTLSPTKVSGSGAALPTGSGGTLTISPTENSGGAVIGAPSQRPSTPVGSPIVNSTTSAKTPSLSPGGESATTANSTVNGTKPTSPSSSPKKTSSARGACFSTNYTGTRLTLIIGLTLLMA